MEGLRWSWLAAPYFACTLAILAVAVATALIRGDRVMRLGMLGASVTAVPWALCQGLAALSTDPVTATHLLRVGQGPIALVSPNLLLLLLAVSGQLERFRWIARLAAIVAAFFLVAAWSTSWTTPGVHRLDSGLYVASPGPLTAAHFAQVVVSAVIGLAIVRRSSPRGERRQTLKLLVGALLLCTLASLDVLVIYGEWRVYPIAWLPALLAACVALYLVLRTDLLRPQGFDRGIALELGAFAIAIAIAGVLAFALRGAPGTIAATASLAWVALMAGAWAWERSQPARVADERALEQFVARVATLDDAAQIAEQLGALWKRTIGIDVRTTWTVEPGRLHAVGRDAHAELDPKLAAWFAALARPLAVGELATMRVGALRDQLEPYGHHLVVPLVDRDELVGLVEADYDKALRDAERALVAESSRAAARAFTFVGLARSAALERETSREVEVAEALRLQASASGDAELGRWAVGAEYRTAPRTTGAGWSAIELPDGRLALLATEAQAHGVAAALATAALTGAFAAATAPGLGAITLDELLSTMRASSDGVMRGGEPVAAFLAILDAPARSIEWACAGHPGACLVGPIAAIDELPTSSVRTARASAVLLGGGARAPGASLTVATRGTAAFPPDTLLVVASSALRGSDDIAWQDALREHAPEGRLATTLVEHSLNAGPPSEDLLAVVVRAR